MRDLDELWTGEIVTVEIDWPGSSAKLTREMIRELLDNMEDRYTEIEANPTRDCGGTVNQTQGDVTK